MKNKIVLLAVLGLGLGLSLHAQTPAPAPTTPADVVTAINTVAVDTNSSFFAAQQFDIRSGYQTQGTLADVGADMNFAAHWQAGADFGFETAGNVISTAQVDLCYRIPVHNTEFDGGLALGYDWDKDNTYAGLVGRFSYVVSQGTGLAAFIQPQLTIPLKEQIDKPAIGIIVGVSKSF